MEGPIQTALRLKVALEGGGAGGTTLEMLTAATLGASKDAVVGAAGTAGTAAAGSNGGNGNASTFGGALTTANGGFGGEGVPSAHTATIYAAAGGAGGTAVADGDVNLGGGGGIAGWGDAEEVNGGAGGASYWGGGGKGATDPTDAANAGAAGVAYGSGGGGAAVEDSATGAAGGAGAGGVVVVTSYTSSGADLAEWYETKDGVEMGDVVAISKDSLEYNSHLDLEKISVLEKAVSGSSVVGVVSSEPFMIMGGDLLGASKHPKPIALAGRVPVKITEENGKIMAGDMLTISSISGVAMRATKAGVTIGRALENADCTDGEICKVLVLVNTSYSNGAMLKVYLKKDGIDLDAIPSGVDVGRIILAQMIHEKKDFATSSTISEISTDRLMAGLEIVSPRVLADEIIANSLEPVENNLTVKLGEDGMLILVRNDEATSSASPVITFDSFGNAIFTGTLMADKIKANQIDLPAEAMLQALQAGGLEVWTDKISSLSGKVAGMSTTEGESVLENILAKGKAIFTDIVEFAQNVIFRGEVNFVGRPTFNKDTAGFALIKKGERQVKITFEKEYASLPVVTINKVWEVEESTLSVIDDMDGFFLPKSEFVIAGLTTKGFTIILEDSAITDFKFSWIAIAVSQTTTFENKTGNGESINSSVPTLTPMIVPSSTPTPTTTPVPVFTPTPIPTMTPEVSPTPSPSIISGKTVTVLPNELGYVRLRDEPSAEANEIGQLPAGGTYPYSEKRYDWYLVETEGKTGWVSGTYIVINW